MLLDRPALLLRAGIETESPEGCEVKRRQTEDLQGIARPFALTTAETLQNRFSEWGPPKKRKSLF